MVVLRNNVLNWNIYIDGKISGTVYKNKNRIILEYGQAINPKDSNITFKNNSGLSNAANRFKGQNGADVALLPNYSVTLIYDQIAISNQGGRKTNIGLSNKF